MGNAGRKPVIIFHSSEPLVAKDLVFRAIWEYADTFAFGLQTDGVLLEEGDIAFLKRQRVSVGISLDSHDPEVHSFLRPAPGGKAAFARTVRAIEGFDGYAGLNVVTTITRHNVRGLAELVDFLHERKVAVAMMNPVRATQPYARLVKLAFELIAEGKLPYLLREAAVSNLQVDYCLVR